MNQDMFNLNNKIYSNNNNLLLGVVNDLQQINNITHDNLVIKRIGDIINKMNYIINDNKKNTQLIINHISLLQNQINKKFDELKVNNNQIRNTQIKYKNGKYIGQVLNGKAEGKGIYYYNNGDKYEGDFRNDKKEGKGILYHNNGDRYEGDFRNGIIEGKGIYYYSNVPWKGDRYEGDFRNNKREGQGIYYFNNGDRMMGDYSNGNPIGKHVYFTIIGEVEIKTY